MVAVVLGEQVFKKGLNIYLNRHKYKNAVTDDLWNALSEASGFPVKDFMDNWTKNTGYPLVSIDSTGKDQFHVKQSRFFSNGNIQTGPNAQKWWIHLTISGSHLKTPFSFDLKDFEATFTVPGISECEWIKVNGGQSGFFRTKYSADLVSKLTKAINSHALSTVDRLGIQNDAFALSKAGFVPTTDALTLVQSYSNEVDYTVWSDLATGLGEFSTVWSGEPNSAHVKSFIRKLFSPIAHKLGWVPKKGESDLETLLRPVVLSVLGGNEDPDTIAEAQKRFAEYQKDPQSLPADLRFIVYKLVVANGSSTDWEAALNIFRTAEMSEEKVRVLRALGHSKHQDLIIRTLDLSLTDEVRAQDMFFVTGNAGASTLGRELTWKFLQQKWSDFERRLGESQFLLSRIISYATKDFTDPEKAKEIEKFFTEHKVPSAERTVKQSIESILANSKWLQSNKGDVAKWLEAHH